MESIHDKIQELSEIDIYEVLGVPENATLQQIKKKYNKLVLKYHPDKIKNPTEKTNEKLGLISEAYKILSVEQHRKMYDRFRELFNEQMKSYTDLKVSYKEYVKSISVDKDDPNYEQKKMEMKQDFDKKWDELNNKHKATTNITPLSTKDADSKLADMIKNRDETMPIHENLFENKEFNTVDFNKAFEETKKKNTGKELTISKIDAMDTMIPYASIYEQNLYACGSDKNSTNCAGLNEAFNLPSSHITTQDIDKMDVKTLEDRMKEYNNMTNELNNRTLKDYSKDDYGDYGIFDKLLLDNSNKKQVIDNNKINDKINDEINDEIIEEMIDFGEKE